MDYISDREFYPHIQKLLGLEDIKGVRKLVIIVEAGEFVNIVMDRWAYSNIGEEPVILTQQYKLAPMENINESEDNADREVEESDRTK